MAHSIQAIVASFNVALAFCNRHPQTKSLRLPQDFGIVPVEREMVEAWTGSTVPQETETFFYLTDNFVEFLKNASSLGRLAYIETEYFGGEGCEGAIVFDNGKCLLDATWRPSAISMALGLLGAKPLNDKVMFRFANEVEVLGIGDFRSNDSILEAIHAAEE